MIVLHYPGAQLTSLSFARVWEGGGGQITSKRDSFVQSKLRLQDNLLWRAKLLRDTNTITDILTLVTYKTGDF